MQVKDLAEQLWKSQRRPLITLAVLVIVNLLTYVVVEQFLVPHATEQETNFLKRQADVRQMLRNQGGAAITPEQLYAMGTEDFTRFQQAVPDYQEFTGLIDELLVLSNRARLNITQVGYHSETLKEAPLLKYTLDFTVTGDYEQLKKFIFALEQSVRLITIKQISLQSTEESGVNLRLSLETFFRTGDGAS
jgi:type IV pilus assembly protein PilO